MANRMERYWGRVRRQDGTVFRGGRAFGGTAYLETLCRPEAYIVDSNAWIGQRGGMSGISQGGVGFLTVRFLCVT